MGYQDCPCFKCDHGGERAKNELHVAKKMHWICCLEVKHAGNKTKGKKEDKDKYYSTTKGKFYKRNLMKQKGGRKIW